jgi:hypothetical protein
MISKEKLKEHIDKFPENEISIDELIERLVFIEKLEDRITKSEEGKELLKEDDLKNEMAKWLK